MAPCVKALYKNFSKKENDIYLKPCTFFLGFLPKLALLDVPVWHYNNLMKSQHWHEFIEERQFYSIIIIFRLIIIDSFRDSGDRGQKFLQDPCLWFFFNQIILQIAFRQNSIASKLCPVARNKSFVSFLYINELYRKKACLLIFSKILFHKFKWKVHK